MPNKSNQTAPLFDGRRWLRISEVARYLNLSEHQCYRMHWKGQLPSFKLPGLGVRVDRTALDLRIEEEKRARAAIADTTWPS